MKARVTAALAALASAALWAAPAGAQSTGPQHQGFDPSVSTAGHYHEGELGEKYLLIERNLKCQCGCGLDVHSCQYQMQCGTSPVWSQRIKRSLEAGQAPETIQAGFVAEFGTQVLMAPPAEGFNLLGYAMPAIMIVMAGALAGLVARGRPRTEGAPAAPVSSADEERLRAALKEIEEAEGPDW